MISPYLERAVRSLSVVDLHRGDVLRPTADVEFSEASRWDGAVKNDNRHAYCPAPIETHPPRRWNFGNPLTPRGWVLVTALLAGLVGYAWGARIVFALAVGQVPWL